MEGTQHERSTPLWFVVVAVVVCGVVAVLLDVPSAALVLAAACAVLAVLRAADRRPAGVFRARSKTFDVVALAILAAGLVVLAPAGNLA